MVRFQRWASFSSVRPGQHAGSLDGDTTNALVVSSSKHGHTGSWDEDTTKPNLETLTYATTCLPLFFCYYMARYFLCYHLASNFLCYHLARNLLCYHMARISGETFCSDFDLSPLMDRIAETNAFPSNEIFYPGN